MLEDATATELFAYARRELSARFDEKASLVHLRAQPDWHTPRESLWHALGLLVEGDVPGADRIIQAVLATQELRDDDPHYGNFRWFAEDPGVVDLNAVEFALEGLTHHLLRFRGQLPKPTLGRIEAAMRLAFDEVSGSTSTGRTRTSTCSTCTTASSRASSFSDAGIAARGRRRLREWAANTVADGAPNEFNSATYSAVQSTRSPPSCSSREMTPTASSLWKWRSFSGNTSRRTSMCRRCSSPVRTRAPTVATSSARRTS